MTLDNSMTCQALESGPAGFALRSGWRAFTTIVMFGRKSASYCTHSAATAANYISTSNDQSQ